MGKREKILLIIYGIFILVFSIKASFTGTGGDFKIYLGAADLLKNGKPFYHVWIPTSPNNALPYLYSPFFAFILIPFTYLPYELSYLLWSLLNIFFVFRIYKIIRSFLDTDKFSGKQALVFLIVLIAFATRFVLYNISLIQVTFLMLYCIIEGVFQLNKNSLKSAVLFAIGVSIKIMPIVIIPYLLVRKQIKTMLLTVLLTIVFLFSPAVYLGINKNTQLLAEWWTVVNPTKAEYNINENLSGEGVHSLSALIPTLLKETESVYDIKLKRNIATLNDETIQLITNVTVLLLVALTLFFLKWPLFTKVSDKKIVFFEISYLCLIIPLIFPHQQKYAFIFILPAVAHITHFVIISKLKGKLNRKLLGLFILSFLLLVFTTDGIIGRKLYHISQHYKLITYGTLLLIFTLWMSRSKRVREISTH